MSNATQAIQDAKLAITKVLADQGISLPNPDMVYWMLGQVYGESLFGTGPDWTIPNELNTQETNPLAPPGPSHNWGAVLAMPGAPFILHKDHDPDGTLVTRKFARPGSPEAGAKNFLSALIRSDINNAVKNVLNDPNATPFDLARAMYTRNEDPTVLKRSQLAYYTGLDKPPTETDQKRIQAYANMIASGANRVKKVLGLPANTTANGPGGAVQPVPVGPPTPYAKQKSPWTPILWALGIAGVGYAVYRWKRRY